MPDGDFKLCPYCRERIRASAIKCRYCGEWLEKPSKPSLQGRIESSILPNQPGKADQIGESQIEAPTSSQLNQKAQSANQVDLPLPPNPAVDAPQPESLVKKVKPGGKASNYFICHWRGELSLGVSFWVNCVLFNVAFTVAFSALVQIGVIFNPYSAAPITAFLFLLFIGISCWQIVGTWRCSQKHTDRGGTKA